MTDHEEFEVLRSTTEDNLLFFKAYVDFFKPGGIADQSKLSKINILTKEEKYEIFLNSFENNGNQLFRSSDKKDHLANVWLSLIKKSYKRVLISQKVEAYNGLDSEDLRTISKLSREVENVSEVVNNLARMGIILIFQKAPPGTMVDGVALVLPNGTPVIGMSLRYGRLDHFWFTLLHELSHIKLHYDKLATPIFDDLDKPAESAIEIEANRLAKSSIVDPKRWRAAEIRRIPNLKNLVDAAHEFEVHPFLIAGLIHHEKNDYSLFSKLLSKIDVRKLIWTTE